MASTNNGTKVKSGAITLILLSVIAFWGLSKIGSFTFDKSNHGPVKLGTPPPSESMHDVVFRAEWSREHYAFIYTVNNNVESQKKRVFGGFYNERTKASKNTMLVLIVNHPGIVNFKHCGIEVDGKLEVQDRQNNTDLDCKVMWWVK